MGVTRASKRWSSVKRNAEVRDVERRGGEVRSRKEGGKRQAAGEVKVQVSEGEGAMGGPNRKGN